VTDTGLAVAGIVAVVGVAQLVATWRIVRRFEARLDARLSKYT
jgi:hypothetical protein